jgi:large subunit ribosomal protein L17
MRHRRSRSLHNRFTSWRKATILSLAKNLLVYQSIRTTQLRASSAQPLVERLIDLAKVNTLVTRRTAYKILGDHGLVKSLFTEIGPRFNSRTGGYTRILKLGLRRGDSASLVLFELTEINKSEIKKHKKTKEEPGADRPKQVQPPTEEHPSVEKKIKPEGAVLKQEKPPLVKKPSRKFLGGLRNIFKRERDSL